MTGYVPCGACAAYVPAGKGCKHYRPNAALSGAVAESRARALARAQAARERARRDVEEFRRQQQLST